MTQLAKNKEIYLEISFLRAIACLLVVIVHVTGVSLGGSLNYVILLLNQFSRLGTPIFAVISAFLLFNSAIKREFNFRYFAVSRITKILFPFIIWTVFYASISFYVKYYTINFKTVVFLFIFGGGYYHLYFITLILQFYLMFPLIQKIKSGKIIFILYLISLPINYFALTIGNIYFFSHYHLKIIDLVINERSFFLKWCSFFLLGSVLAHYFDDITSFIKNKKKDIYALSIFLLICIFYEISVENNLLTSSRPSSFIYIPVFIAFLLCIYPCIKHPAILKLSNLIGSYSMGIYFIHPFVIFMLESLPKIFWSSPYLTILVFIITVIISMLLIRTILYLPMSRFIVPVPSLGKNQK
jgi:surface polysaccharide O-acyltransferase-like enzyme